MNLLGLKTLKYIGKDGGYFGSPHPSFPFVWGTERLAQATCKHCGDDCPGEFCPSRIGDGCGIYATYKLEVAMEYWTQTACVLTLVEAGDKTIVYSEGWRSRQGFVRAIVNHTPGNTRIHEDNIRIMPNQMGVIFAMQYWPEVSVINLAGALEAIDRQVHNYNQWRLLLEEKQDD